MQCEEGEMARRDGCMRHAGRVRGTRLRGLGAPPEAFVGGCLCCACVCVCHGPTPWAPPRVSSLGDGNVHDSTNERRRPRLCRFCSDFGTRVPAGLPGCGIHSFRTSDSDVRRSTYLQATPSDDMPGYGSDRNDELKLARMVR